MRIGDLRHRITLQKAERARDSYGGEQLQWADFAKVWAAIYPLQGREYFAAQQINAEVSTKIVIRYIKGVEPTMRVNFENRNFEIISVIHVAERKKELQLMCKEVV